eukprot:517535-Hanusia_phi.AAC.3
MGKSRGSEKNCISGTERALPGTEYDSKYEEVIDPVTGLWRSVQGRWEMERLLRGKGLSSIRSCTDERPNISLPLFLCQDRRYTSAQFSLLRSLIKKLFCFRPPVP